MITDVIALALPSIVLAMTMYSWYRTARLSGRMPLRVAAWMIGLAWRSRHRYLLCVALGGLALTALYLVASLTMGDPAHPALLLSVATLSSAMLMAVCQPPAIVLLAGSGEATLDLLRSINLAITPLKAVALLEDEHAGVTQRFRIRSLILGSTLDPKFNNLRTTDQQLWQSVVHQLVDIAPIVVVDTRDPGPAVAQETFIMLAPERAGKAVFVVDADGSCPALVANGVDPYRHALRAVAEEDLLPELVHMLDEMPGLTQAPASVDSGAMWKPHRPIREDFEGLPSVLLLVLGDTFDSSDAIAVARKSDKDLLILLPPGPEIGTSETRRRIYLLYEFLHDPRLVLMIVQPRYEVLIRNSFLVEVARQLRLHTGRNVWPVTFGEQDEKAPVRRALHGFVEQLRALAREGGSRYRVVKETGRPETWI